MLIFEGVGQNGVKLWPWPPLVVPGFQITSSGLRTAAIQALS